MNSDAKEYSDYTRLPRLPVKPPPEYVTPSYVTDGMTVFINCRIEGRVVGLKCTVKQAFGDAAWIENKKYNVLKLMSIDDIYVEKTHGS